MDAGIGGLEGVPMMSGDLKDWFQVAAWVVATVGGLVAAFKAVAELRRSNIQRLEDMRWKRAEMAKKCIDQIRTNAAATAALKMLDWDGLQYDLPSGGKTEPITHSLRSLALRTTNTVFEPAGAERFVRDAFDALFEEFQSLEHFLRIKLIVFEDIELAFSYYADRLAAASEFAVIFNFLDVYGFKDAIVFLDRFPAWKATRASN